MMRNEITTETVRERVVFLVLEWILIVGWLLSLAMIWRQSVFYTIYVGIGFGWGNRAIFIIMVMVLMGLAVVALTMTGVWLTNRPKTQTLFIRWVIGMLWLAITSAIGYAIIMIYGGSFSP